jgi:monoamine oxidase
MLARPLDATLFFAGEATEPEETGTVSGAIASGRRAARQVEMVLGSRKKR